MGCSQPSHTALAIPLGAKHCCGAGWDATPRTWGEGQRLAGAGSGLRAPRCGGWHQDTSQGHGLMQGRQSAFPFFIESIAFSLDFFPGDEDSSAPYLAVQRHLSPHTDILVQVLNHTSIDIASCKHHIYGHGRQQHNSTWLQRNITLKITWYFVSKTDIHFVSLLASDICFSDTTYC